MEFAEILTQVIELLQRQGRISYGALKRRFHLDAEYLQDLKDELIDAQQVARDEGGRVLVWVGTSPVAGSTLQVSRSHSQSQPSDARPQTLDTPPAAREAERRQLTVMFCDLVGSTPLAEQLDPEELREVVRAYQDTCTAVVHRFEGYIARYVGDALLVYFGYPQAHEDDAPRAMRAGLGIVAALPELNARVHQLMGKPQVPPLQVRMGIHTGLVVVGELGGRDYREAMALGETPNIAARLQGVAAPDTLVISAATYQLVQGLFECQDLGRHTLKGVTTPLALYRVLGEGAAQSRFEVAIHKGLTPLVGRDEELGLLQRRWEQAKAGEGQVVLLSGEPGIGKSRLVQMLKEHASAEGATHIEFRCSPYHQNSAFYPVIEHMQRLLQFAPHDTPQAKLTKLQQTLAHYRFPQADTLPLLASLLSLPHPEGARAITVNPQRQKQKTQEALVAWIVEEAEKAAVYCAWEDLHWVDPSTLEVLTLFLDQVPTSRLLALLTFRPDLIPPWRPRSHITQLTLNRLGRQPVEVMVETITGGKPLPREVVQQIVAKTDGVPLFVEELTKTVLEAGWLREAEKHYELAGPLPPLAIPSTLQDSLMARLDRLAPVREIAQLGATVGREFSYELLHAVSPLGEETLQQGLRQLVEVELLYQRGLPPQATYLFKHALIRDAAYQALLKSKRQQYHSQIAQILEERFADLTEAQPELVAHHYTEAGLIEQAIPHWQQAGTLAIKRLALKEAIAHLNRGMEILGTLPPSPERDGKELDLRILLGTAWSALKGQGVPEVWTSLHPALGLAKSLGRREALVPIYWGLWGNVNVQGRVAESLDWTNEALVTAEASGNRDLLIVGHWTACTTYHWLGDCHQSQAHGDRVLALYDEEQHRHIVDLTNIDPKTGAGIHNSLATWMLGYPDHAVQISEASVAHARRRGHPYSLGWALHMNGWLWDFRREPAQMLARAEEVEHLGRAHSLPLLSEVLAQTIKGVAWLRAGRLAESIPQLRGVIETWSGHGVEITLPYYRAVLAECLALSGDSEGGLRLIEESLTQIARPGWEERCDLAEILRLKGWMFTLRGDLDGAEQHYLASLDWARRQQAKFWELRTATSLARLWQRQGQRQKAYELLAPVYNWFTEGFGTKDLQEARALLEDLA